MNYITNLENPTQVLDLPEGSLIMNIGFWVEVSFSTEDVVEAAEMLIENKDTKKLFSQAGVISRAGKYGWGLGDVYRAG